MEKMTASSAKQRKSQRVDQAMALGAAILAVGLFHVHREMNDHIESCSARWGLIVKIMTSIAVMVFGELIIRGFSLFHLVTSVATTN
jgi:hypothetical protein